MKTYLVTGGAGFIGSHLIDRLLSLGHQVINIDNFNDFYDIKIKELNIINHLKYKNAYTLKRVDLTSAKSLSTSLSDLTIDGIIHLAARAGVRPSIDNPSQYVLDNIVGTQNILDFARDRKIKYLVLASSSSVYGNNKKTPFSESDLVDHPISPYASTKKANELQAHAYHHLFDMNIIMLRFFTVYGPRQRPDLAIHKFMNLIQQGKPIPFFGDGSTARDYTYIDDIVDGILSSMRYVETHKNVYEVINLGNHHPINLMEMVKTIESVLKQKAILNRLPMQDGDVEMTYADINKANKLLNYAPKVTFRDGIKRFNEWFTNSKV
jgi:UDP-glucuronate 4-epimerase